MRRFLGVLIPSILTPQQVCSAPAHPADGDAAQLGLPPVRTRVDGTALRRARLARGLTQHQLARLIDVAGGERIALWERGISEPRARLVPLLASALGVEPLELLEMPNGTDLKALRLASGLTAPEVAAAAHVSLPTYLHWESGRRLPVADQRMLGALGRQLRVARRPLVSALERSRAPKP